MLFLEIPFQSDWYAQACVLRNQLLRLPLGLDLQTEDLSPESEYLHFGIEQEGQIVAYVLAVPMSDERAKLRQMAVATAYQGQGLGRRLLELVEASLKQKGIQMLELDARKEAVGFYEKLGYAVEGDEFISVTIPHQRMTKAIVAD
ncbi:GNAT family N-acetyltransferase [Gimesia panareensis]|uniref:Putative N-acetyltransferase YjcF n=1 Tax=Gimesia panareensis TaxID=2527978 RepID=A0A518A2Z0_9PLAN|nr:GNAT family N-acetyltransferase [Gimesia panareensis]QDT26085.1 putative N-acetyltransferase YjcF [Gimesia panareensis]QDU49021.1 putative N-acetyltransferase YjcF [Gimesia panareensis]